MLHIHNGDSSANTAKQTSLPGEHFAFREALIDGPTPEKFNGNDSRFVRAQHLWEAYGIDLEECLGQLLAQEQKLATFSEHDEVVLWFEHDLFCQLQLIYLLAWFGRQDMQKTSLSLVCINQFPGRENFRGLGELNPDELASLFPARQPVTDSQLELGSVAWAAYCSDDPTNLQKFLETDTSHLPFLKDALDAHLRRFPATTNGLGLVGNTLLRLVDNGATRFTDLFKQFGDALPIYGLGDAQIWNALRQLNLARLPLLIVKNGGQLGKSIAGDAEFEITETGKAVLRNEADFVSLNGVEYWLGGVQLSGRKHIWRWDDGNKKLVNSK